MTKLSSAVLEGLTEGDIVTVRMRVCYNGVFRGGLRCSTLRLAAPDNPENSDSLLVHTDDVISVEVPPFDWKYVQSGMAFKAKDGEVGEVYYYVGKDLSDDDYVTVVFSGDLEDPHRRAKKDLIRYYEGDL